METLSGHGQRIKQEKIAGFIQASLCKFKDFQGLLKDSPVLFKDYKFMKNTDVHFKILLQKL